MADQLGLHRRDALRRPHQAGRELRRRARPVVRRRALGGAERLLAVDDRRRDRRARRGRPTSPTSNGDPASAARLARRRRRLPALDQGLDGDDERPARRRRYFIRLSKTGDPNAAITLQRRQRRPDARPARGHRRRASSSWSGSASCRRTTRTSLASLPVVDATIKGDTAERRRAGTATTATATATRATRRPARGRRAARAPGTSGRCCRPSAASRQLATGDPAGGGARCSPRWRASRPASG